MDGYSVLCLLLAGGGVIFGVVQRLRARRQLAQVDRMLDRALEGQFQETTFDESAPSALEAKLARFLNGSAASARGLAEERGRIAALIADISHQTKTPIAALLLYSSLLAESPLPPEQREQARVVQAQAEKLRFLIETLVKSSRLDSGILVLTPATRWPPCWRRRPPSIPERRRRKTSPSPCSPPRAAPGSTKSGPPRPWATWWTMR